MPDGAEPASRILRRVRVVWTGAARRFGRPAEAAEAAEAAGSALPDDGFTADQIAALAALSIH